MIQIVVAIWDVGHLLLFFEFNLGAWILECFIEVTNVNLGVIAIETKLIIA